LRTIRSGLNRQEFPARLYQHNHLKPLNRSMQPILLKMCIYHAHSMLTGFRKVQDGLEPEGQLTRAVFVSSMHSSATRTATNSCSLLQGQCLIDLASLVYHPITRVRYGPGCQGMQVVYVYLTLNRDSHVS
jgi:hypothetical protein